MRQRKTILTDCKKIFNRYYHNKTKKKANFPFDHSPLIDHSSERHNQTTINKQTISAFATLSFSPFMFVVRWRLVIRILILDAPGHSVTPGGYGTHPKVSPDHLPERDKPHLFIFLIIKLLHNILANMILTFTQVHNYISITCYIFFL